jgi:TctA family transporter
MAWMLSSVYVPYTPWEYWLAVGTAALCCALASALLILISRQVVKLSRRISFRWISWVTLFLLVALTGGLTGWRGMLVMLAGTGIGLVPIMFHSRRMNCMGVLLAPAILRMAGLGPVVARWLGLV